MHSAHSLSLAFYQEETCHKFEPYSFHFVSILSTSALMRAITVACSSQILIYLQKFIKLLLVHCSMLRTNQGSYLEAHLSGVDRNVSSVCQPINFFSFSHLHMCSRYALCLIDN